GDAGVEQGPAASGQEASAATTDRPETAGTTVGVGLEEGAETGGAVAGHQPARHECPQRLLRGGGEEAGRARDVGEERGAASLEMLEHGARIRRKVARRLRRSPAQEPREA